MLLNIKTNTNYIERSNTLVDYYKDVQQYDVLDERKEKKLFKELKELKELREEYIKENDNITAKECEKEINSIRDKIANANLRFVISVAKVYATNDNISDLISEGNIGLMEAIDSYDMDKNTKFSSWAVFYIRRQINLYRQEDGEIIRKHNISKTFHIIANVTNKFIQDNGREPSSDELMEYVNDMYPNLEIKDHTDLIKLNVIRIDSVGDSDEDESNVGNVITYDTVSASSNNYEKEIEMEHKKEMITSMLHTLSDREKKIMKMYFGIDQPNGSSLSADEIGEEVGLTNNRVRQIIAECIDKLKHRYANKVVRF